MSFETYPVRKLTLFDSTCIIVGIIIGSGIFQTTPEIANCLPNGWAVLLLWAAGGLLSLAGALCYAELASAYPHQGGDYIYLTRAFGTRVGYLFAWGQLVIVRPGSIAAILFPFGHYLAAIFNPLSGSPWEKQMEVAYAVGAVVALTFINMFGLRESKSLQNLLSVAKAAGLLMIVAAAFALPTRHSLGGSWSGSWDLNLAMILILFTYGGWNEIAYVAAEVKEPSKNLLRSLVVGVALVTAIYILVNWAFLAILGHNAMTASEAVAKDSVQRVWPGYAATSVALLICISTLGSAHGMIFTGARIAYAFGREQPRFKWLAQWSPRSGTPRAALAFQGALSAAIVVATGSFNQTVIYTTAVVWAFFLATGLSVFVLRRQDAATPRPYRVSGHPFTTTFYCLSCVFLVYSAYVYDPKGTMVAFLILASGLLFRR